MIYPALIISLTENFGMLVLTMWLSISVAFGQDEHGGSDSDDSEANFDLFGQSQMKHNLLNTMKVLLNASSIHNPNYSNFY